MRYALICFAAFLSLSASSRGANQAPAPAITSTPAQSGALLVHLRSDLPHAEIRYTVDGSVPTEKAQRYEAPFLVASTLTVKAVAIAPGTVASPVAAQAFTPQVPSGALVWSDEFNGKGARSQPDPNVWTYDTGNNGFGNHELEDYCAWGSNETPCSAADPSAYVGQDGYLHVVARQVRPGVYTSARLKSQGLFSFQYGRFEVRARVPEAQGYWPAVWLLGNDITTVDWPACGEQDVLERVNAAKSPDWNEGSIHGVGFTGDTGLGTIYNFPAKSTAAEWHTYGMIWDRDRVAYYVDDAAHPYVTYTQRDLDRLPGAVWPFNHGQSNFLLINLAIGGDWPKAPEAATPFPAEMLIDYVRVYAN